MQSTINPSDFDRISQMRLQSAGDDEHAVDRNGLQTVLKTIKNEGIRQEDF